MAENYNELVIDFYQQNDDIWLKYNFIEHINSHHLQFFANYVKNLYLKIPHQNWELIEYATNLKQ